MDSDGRIVLAGTPIGDGADATPRLRELLATADLIAAEDTRRTGSLAERLGVTITGRLLSYHEHNEATRAVELVQAAAQGQVVLVVTDAGMPGISDPGYRVVQAAIEADVPITAAPGPSAVPTALALSGLASDRFCFEGFVPRKPGERRRMLTTLAHEQRTMVFFESPHRIAATLTAMAQTFGDDRCGAVCRELTKTYEQVRRGTLVELAQWAADGVRGEITIVIAGDQPIASDPRDYVPDVLARAANGERLKDAVSAVAATTGSSRRELYQAVLQARSTPPQQADG
ncbi:MAG: 16S rRNA (cytidine(1402)-2'-O)-methyltransferase [Beutenbergiaceae bacterium]